MPLIDDSAELVRIDLPAEGEWVDVKPRISIGERQRINAAGLAFSVKVRGQEAELGGDVPIDSATMDAIAFAALEIGIKAWSFGGPETLTPDNIRKLDEDSYDVIFERLNRMWARRTKEQEAPLSESGATPSEASEAPPASSPG